MKTTYLKSILIVLFVICVWSNSLKGQQQKIDSLKLELETETKDTSRVDILFRLCAIYNYISIDTIDRLLSKAEPILDKLPDSDIRKQKYAIVKGQYHSDKGEFDKVIAVLSEGERIGELSESSNVLLSIKRRLMGAYLDSRKLDKAIEVGLDALRYEENNPNKKERANILGNLGSTYRNTHQLEESEKYFLESIKVFKELNDTTNVVQQLANYAIMTGVKSGKDAALAAFKEALTFGGNAIRPTLKANLCKDIAMTAALANQTDTAYHYIDKAVELSKEFDIQSFEINLLMAKSLIYSKTGRCKDVFPILEKVEKVAEETNNLRWKRIALQSKTDCLTTLGKHKEAGKVFKQRLSLKDTILKNDISKAVAEASTKYETEKKEAEIQRLSLEEELNQTQISRQRLALGGSAIGLSLLSFLLYRLFGQNKKIESQNQVITKALSEKETLLKEIHHRVKNNLQVISSLLRIQSNQTDDEVAVDALKEGQSRVQAMSLIHEDLYQHDDLSAINVNDYFKKLTENIFNTYNTQAAQVTLIQDFEDVELDIDTVVPLGLIINELITNALKYAFPDNRKGELALSLKKKDDHIQIIVKDNGVGMDDHNNRSGFGAGLISSLVAKLDGEMTTKSEAGHEIQLMIPK